MKRCVALVGLLACLVAQAEAREVHGESDAVALDGVTVVWAVLRSAAESDAIVVLRIGADIARFDSVEVVGSDPFTRATSMRMPRVSLMPNTSVRLRRAGFSDYPRTELRIAGPAGQLVVYYLGVPDTTPEFTDADLMEAYLRQRSARFR